MSLEELKESKSFVVGTKQTTRAIAEGQAKKVFLALDADRFLQIEIEKQCRENHVLLESVPTMMELGKWAGIEVKAAVATILDEQQ